MTLVLASEYVCQDCWVAAQSMIELRRMYPRDLRVAYRPLVAHPRESMSSALAACAAIKQGRFAELDAALWARYRQWSVRPGGGTEPSSSPFDLAKAVGSTQCWDEPTGCPIVLGLARRLSLDMRRFAQDMDRCEGEVRRAQTEIGAGAGKPPVIFVNGRRVVESTPNQRFAAINRMIAEELELARARVQKGAKPIDYYREWVLTRGKTSAKDRD